MVTKSKKEKVVQSSNENDQVETPPKPRKKASKTEEKPKVKGQENLVPLNKRAKDVQRKIQSSGGKAKAQKVREEKLLREKFKIAMSMPLKEGKVVAIDEVKNFEDAKEANMTLEDRMIMQLARRAANGDPQIYMLYREERGQKLPERHQIEATVRMVDDKKLKELKKRIDKDPDLLAAIMGDDAKA